LKSYGKKKTNKFKNYHSLRSLGRATRAPVLKGYIVKKLFLILIFIFSSDTLLADSCGTEIIVENRSADLHLVRFIMHSEEVSEIPDEKEDRETFMKRRGGQVVWVKPNSLRETSLIVPCGMGFTLPPDSFWLSYKILGESNTSVTKLTNNLKITIE